MAWPAPPYPLPLHRRHGDKIRYEWNQLARLAGVGVTEGEPLLDVWNRIADNLGMPAKVGSDIITADEWNEAVNRATARHA